MAAQVLSAQDVVLVRKMINKKEEVKRGRRYTRKKRSTVGNRRYRTRKTRPPLQKGIRNCRRVNRPPRRISPPAN